VLGGREFFVLADAWFPRLPLHLYFAVRILFTAHFLFVTPAVNGAGFALALEFLMGDGGRRPGRRGPRSAPPLELNLLGWGFYLVSAGRSFDLLLATFS
jgi:hypothetical protein